MELVGICMLVWGILFIVFAVLEAATTQLVSIWCSVGSLAAVLAAMFGAPIPVQILLFIVVSALLILCTRPLARRLLKGKLEPTNADQLIGAEAMVLDSIDNRAGTGRVRAQGQDWAAQSETGSLIPAGKQVEIVRIEGVRLIVHDKEEN